MLFNPKKAQFDHPDERSREIMKKTIDFFETKIDAVEDDLMDQTFDFMVRDFSKFALQLYCKTSSTSKQMEVCMKIIKKPVVKPERFNRIWEKQVYGLKETYRMND